MQNTKYQTFDSKSGNAWMYKVTPRTKRVIWILEKDGICYFMNYNPNQRQLVVREVLTTEELRSGAVGALQHKYI